MTEYLSQKLKAISFFAIIMVVLLHCYNLDIKQAGVVLKFEKGYNWYIQTFISSGLTRIAVPLFFLISGFLFFFSFNGNFDFLIKIKKRFKTLVIPYFFWVFFGAIFYFILQTFPQSQHFFTKKLIREFDFLDWLNIIFVNPIPYQLWFLRDLIILMILSPLIYFLVKRTGLFFLFFLSIFWFLNQDNYFFTSESILFFSTGIFIVLKKPEISLKKIRKPLIFFFLTAWIFFLILKTTLEFYTTINIYSVLSLKISILFGIPAFWLLYDLLFENTVKRVENYNKVFEFSFFIYLFHEPVLTIIKKGLFFILGKEEKNYLLIYFLSGFLIITLSLAIGFLMKKSFPVIYGFISGNR